MRLLARREHSCKELNYKLTQRGFLPAEIELTLSALIKSKALSHERFAHSYVYARVSKGFGPVRIANELRERGIADDLIVSALSEYQHDWLAYAKRVDVKRFGQQSPQDKLEHYKRSQFLSYRGFDSEDIKQVWKCHE